MSTTNKEELDNKILSKEEAFNSTADKTIDDEDDVNKNSHIENENEKLEETNIRKDAKGNIISKANKLYHVSFKQDFAEVIDVESYKEYNILNDKNEYLNKLDNNGDEENEDDDGSSDNEDKDKFDINKYNPIKLEKMASHDPNGFSRTKCIII